MSLITTEAHKSRSILHVIASLSIQTGGPAINTVAICRQLETLGLNTTILTTDALTPARADKAKRGATLQDFPVGAGELNIQVFPLTHPFSFAFAPGIGNYLNNNVHHFDAIHVHSVNLYPQLAAWQASRRHRVPIILSPRGALDPWIRGKRRWLKQLNDLIWQRRMLNEVAALHLTTEDEMHLIEPMGLQAPKFVIPNAFHVAEFAAPANGDAFRDRWLSGYPGLLILNHGRLTEKKGLDILLNAAAIVRQSGMVRLALVGSDDEGMGSKLRGLSSKLGISAIVTIVPSLSGDDLKNAIAAADVWALPSHTENFGMAVVEAMAAGKPVVTSPHVNMASDAAAANALMMVSNTPEEMAAAIRSLLDDPECRERLGRTAAEYVWRYDWSVIGQRFVDLYEVVVGKRP